MMKNITPYNDITFHEDGMTVRQAYGIGRGKLITKQDLYSFANGRNQGDTGLVVIDEFSKPHVVEGRVNCHTNDNTTTGTRFPCPESGCLCLFTSHKDFEDHALTGKHVSESESMETLMDKARKKWAKYCNDLVKKGVHVHMSCVT
jgi:hypothetical protein